MRVWTLLVNIWTHPANAGRRPQALARSVAYQVRARVTKRPVLARLGTARVWVHLHETGMSRAVYGNPPDYAEMRCWEQLLSPGDLFVDIGANAGVYSIWAASHGAEVVAVEPNPQAVERLEANAALNDFHVTIHCKAVSATSGVAAFSTTGDVLGHLAEGGDIEVQTVTLDELLDGRRARGVKIDVEGYERWVVEGARRSLSAGLVDYLQLEWNGASVDAVGEDRSAVEGVLAEYGYVLLRPDNAGALRPATAADRQVAEDLFACRPGLA